MSLSSSRMQAINVSEASCPAGSSAAGMGKVLRGPDVCSAATWAGAAVDVIDTRAAKSAAEMAPMCGTGVWHGWLVMHDRGRRARERSPKPVGRVSGARGACLT